MAPAETKLSPGVSLPPKPRGELLAEKGGRPAALPPAARTLRGATAAPAQLYQLEMGLANSFTCC